MRVRTVRRVGVLVRQETRAGGPRRTRRDPGREAPSRLPGMRHAALSGPRRRPLVPLAMRVPWLRPRHSAGQRSRRTSAGRNSRSSVRRSDSLTCLEPSVRTAPWPQVLVAPRTSFDRRHQEGKCAPFHGYGSLATRPKASIGAMRSPVRRCSVKGWRSSLTSSGRSRSTVG